MISYIIFSLKVKTVKTHAFTSLTYFLNYSCTDVISIHISIDVFSCLVFILFLYKFCKSISRTRSFEKLRVIILELFHPIVHQCTKNVLKVLKIAHQLCHPSFISLYQAKKTILVNLSSVLKSDHLQYNTLVCWFVWTKDSSIKCYKYYSFFIIFCKSLCKKSFQFISIFFL